MAPFGERRRVGAFLIGVALTAAVLTFAPRPTGQEPLARATWAAHIPTAKASEPDQTTVGFRVSRHLGYVNGGGGGISFHEPILYGAALGGDYFINYSEVSANLAIRDTRGGLVAGVATAGYPVVAYDGDWLLALARTGDQVSAHATSDGAPLWQASVGAPITCIAIDAQQVLIGTAAGTLWLFDRGGQRRERMQVGGGEVDVVFGCASHPGGRAAVVAGLRPQRLHVLQTSPVLTATSAYLLDSNHRREVPVAFNSDGLLVATASAIGTVLIDIETGRAHRLAAPRPRLIRMTGAGRGSLVAVAAGAELVISGPDGRRLLASSTTAIEWMEFSAGGLLMGIDDALLRVDIESR